MTHALTHQQIATNGITLHAAIQGEGPLVIFCHGFPGLWYSWRHQLQVVADAGWKAVALDMRGYGQSDRPAEIAAYSADEQIADMLGVIETLGEQQAVFVGHDFGAPLVWNLASRQAQAVAGVIALSVPYGYALGATDIKPSAMYAEIAKQHFIHLHYFQKPGVADAELGNDPKLFLTRLFWALSARGNLLDWTNHPFEGTGYLDVLAEPDYPLPWDWMSKADMDYYVQEYTLPGNDQAFTGGLNSYRVADINWEIDKRYPDLDVNVPALFITGEEDPVLKLMTNDALDIMRSRVPDLRGMHFVPDAGHFVQQEQATAVNTAVLEFLATL